MTQMTTPDTAKPLTPRRRRFVEEYLVNHNGAKAARRAGYSERTARTIASEILTFPDVALAIREAQVEQSKRTKVTADRVLEGLAQIAFASIGDAVEWGPDGVTLMASSELSADVMAAIFEVSETPHEDGRTIRVKMHDKLKALITLGRHLGMFVDRVEHSGTVDIDAPVYRQWSLEELDEMLRAKKALEGEGSVTEVLEGGNDVAASSSGVNPRTVLAVRS